MNIFIIYMRACMVLAIILFVLFCILNSKLVAKYLIAIYDGEVTSNVTLANNANNAVKSWKDLIENHGRENLKIGLTPRAVFFSAIIAIILSVVPIINIISLICYSQIINVYIEAYKYFKEKE